eukprot:TRINITY_DN1433_c0_g1_i1.p1 TRINITY_DN1433_c0_g1~~TRINITY_DN1433_c0_g1_i1.p1  ORF type:complete len:535 (-),score=144.93 TRINITY_DN1433_c0_g1_i1:35-1639(-)
MEETTEFSPRVLEQYDILTHDIEEVIGEHEIKTILEKDGKLKIYWGTATTGRPHLGYFVPIYKIADFLRADSEVTILFADLHGFLDNQKSNWEVLNKRCEYYQFIITTMLDVIGVDQSKLNFVTGTSFQLQPEYTLDMYKLAAVNTVAATSHAGAEVVKQAASPYLSNLMYPILQALDEEYLGVNVQFGGVDQRKIFMFARTNLPKIGYSKRSYLMNPLIPGLGKPVDGKPAKMSSSLPLSKVDFDDSNKAIKNKFKRAYSVDGEVENNGLLAILKYIIIRKFIDTEQSIVIPRREEHGGPQEFHDYASVEQAFVAGELYSGDLKTFLANEVIQLISPIREAIRSKMDLYYEAYPELKPQPKKKRQPKKKGPPPATLASLDLRVGKVLTLENVEWSEKLYIETIDVGDDQPRTILSGLRNHVAPEDFLGKNVLVVCNLAPRPMKEFTSEGMVLCASSENDIKLIDIPEGAVVGERVFCEEYPGEPDLPTISKGRYSKIAKLLSTDEDGVCQYREAKFQVSSGYCTTGLPSAKLS